MLQVYTSSGDMFSKSTMFDNSARNGPKVIALKFLPQLSSLQLAGNAQYNLQAIVSEYAVTGNDAGRGTLIAALAEAAFLIGLERNRFLNAISGLALGYGVKAYLFCNCFYAAMWLRWQAVPHSL